ncbi:MAG: hypothetical protein A3K06_01585 [Candidatus Doudnabacteria bacterium RIFCSPHIGHO2_01_52_17]|uniref:Uncharacterized protein n=1 Tax=Candidatus Doudnabacteria bacterium RIFCSPHIGHO2_01_52_17 TaxID=1817820 RepID=A0A1F5NBU2_9BACT|nr:MAG: hypothetical protein A3K06_01585 [Candidatus Doudnabacteria bacterium RIFCSPHIGHO2_01_52_17]
MKRPMGRFLNLLILLIPMVTLYGLVSIVTSDTEQRVRESATATFRAATDVTAGQPREFGSLPDGNYAVDCVVEQESRTASIRLVIPTADILYLVNEIPAELLTPGVRYRKRGVSWTTG